VNFRESCYRLAKLGMEDWLQWCIAVVCFLVTMILQSEVALFDGSFSMESEQSAFDGNRCRRGAGCISGYATGVGHGAVSAAYSDEAKDQAAVAKQLPSEIANGRATGRPPSLPGWESIVQTFASRLDVTVTDARLAIGRRPCCHPRGELPRRQRL
jgi:hypothetical protein